MTRRLSGGLAAKAAAGILMAPAVAEVETQLRRYLSRRGVEALHDLRVATRRLRAGIYLFGPANPVAGDRAAEEIRAITALMREARDLDVRLGLLRGLSAGAGCRRMLAALVADTASARAVARGRMDADLAEFAGRGHLRRHMETFGSGLSQAHLGDLAAERLGRRLFTMWRHAVLAASPGSGDARKHLLRIAVKKTRYLLELVRPLYRPAAARWITSLKGLQSRLGDLHDDVLLMDYLKRYRRSGTEGACVETWISIVRHRKKRLEREVARLLLGMERLFVEMPLAR